MSILRIDRFTSYRANVPLQIKRTVGSVETLSKLPDTAKTFWVVWTKPDAPDVAIQLPEAQVRLLTPEEIAALPDDGNRDNSTWVKLELPYSDAAGAFATLTECKLRFFYGSTLRGPDGIRCFAPLTIERTDDGREGEVK